MSEYILNLLPLKDGEEEEFQAIAPGAVHVRGPERYGHPGTAGPGNGHLRLAQARGDEGGRQPEVVPDHVGRYR